MMSPNMMQSGMVGMMHGGHGMQVLNRYRTGTVYSQIPVQFGVMGGGGISYSILKSFIE
jgi:hypothetical protein